MLKQKNPSQRKISCFRILFGKDRITKPCAAHGYNFVLHNILYDGGNNNTLKWNFRKGFKNISSV